MKSLLPARISLAISLLVGLLMGALFAPSSPARLKMSYWLVRVTIYKDQPPVIENVSMVNSAHPIYITPGENVIHLISVSGQVLESQSFRANFDAADFPGGMTSAPYIFFISDHPDAATLVLRTSQGEAHYELGR